MLGCSYGRIFRTTVAGGSYQEGLTTHIQGVPPGLLITEEEIYADLLLRKPGQGELASPRREPDVPVIYSGVNAADTMEGFPNANLTNGTPLVILIPNLDRHFEHIEQYRSTNRTPRPGHASYASYQKYGSCDDSIGAGFFSGRYTATIVAAGTVAKRILQRHGIEITAYVKEAAGVRAGELSLATVRERVAAFKKLRRDNDLLFRMPQPCTPPAKRAIGDDVMPALLHQVNVFPICPSIVVKYRGIGKTSIVLFYPSRII